MGAWVDAIEPSAYGALELKPWELSKLQPHEFNLLLEGYHFRQKRDDAKTAYFTSLLLNMSGKFSKKAIKVKDVLKPLYPDTK